MIQNKFLFFRTLESFKRQLELDNIPFSSIAFIEDEKVIWNRGSYYGSTEFKDNRCKGYFSSFESLATLVPSPETGDWAIANINGTWKVCSCKRKGRWSITDYEYLTGGIDLNEYVKYQDLNAYVKLSQISGLVNRDELSVYITGAQLNNKLGQYATKTELTQKQDKLVSRENIMEINGQSLLLPGSMTVLTPDNLSDYVGGAINIPEITVDDALSNESDNPVQNRVVKSALDAKVDYSTLKNYTTPDLVQNIIGDQISIILKNLEKGKGYFDSLEELKYSVPNPEVGDWAIVGTGQLWMICRCATAGEWALTNQRYEQEKVDLSGYAKTTDVDTKLANKQDVLVSGVHVKKVNNEDLVGSGNISLPTFKYVDDKIKELATVVTAIQNKYISWYGDNSGLIVDSTEQNAGQDDPIYTGDIITPGDSTKHIFLEESEYNDLLSYTKDAIYFVYEPLDRLWVLGDMLPITLS